MREADVNKLGTSHQHVNIQVDQPSESNRHCGDSGARGLKNGRHSPTASPPLLTRTRPRLPSRLQCRDSRGPPRDPIEPTVQSCFRRA